MYSVPFSFKDTKRCPESRSAHMSVLYGIRGIKSTGSSYSCSIYTEEEYIEKNPRANSIAYASIDSSVEKNPRSNPIAYSFTDSSLSVTLFKPALLLLQPICHTETVGLAKHLQPMCHTDTAGLAKHQPLLY